MTTKTTHTLAADAHAHRAAVKQKSEARDRAGVELERVAAEQPRLRQALADAADLVKKAKVAQLLSPSTGADAELADAQKKYDATAALVNDAEEKRVLLSTVIGELHEAIKAERDHLKRAEDAILLEVLKGRAEASTPVLRQIVTEIQLLLSFSGTLGMEAALFEARHRLEDSGRPIHEDIPELRQKILAEEGAL